MAGLTAFGASELSLIDATGGSARVFRHSSGAMLTLEAARVELPIAAMVLHEPLLVVDGSHSPVPADLAERVRALAAASPCDPSGDRARRGALRRARTRLSLSPTSAQFGETVTLTYRRRLQSASREAATTTATASS